MSDETQRSGGLFSRLRRGLARTRELIAKPLADLVRPGADREAQLSSLQRALVEADVGPALSAEIAARVRATAKAASSSDVVALLRAELLAVLDVAPRPARSPEVRPRVVFFVGVNGTGKTTTIGKRAAQLRAAGERPLLVACDTFRAAAVDQLAIWSERSGAPIVKQAPGADPAAVLHDGLSRAKERGESPVLVDTAGRLHVKGHLMEELAKMGRVAGRLCEGAPHEALLVIDATTGQNGVNQAREFGKVVPLTGLVLTKLDGTAKGGIAVAIAREFGVPIQMVGVGESLEDLLPFDARAFVDGLLGVETG